MRSLSGSGILCAVVALLGAGCHISADNNQAGGIVAIGQGGTLHDASISRTVIAVDTGTPDRVSPVFAEVTVTASNASRVVVALTETRSRGAIVALDVTHAGVSNNGSLTFNDVVMQAEVSSVPNTGVTAVAAAQLFTRQGLPFADVEGSPWLRPWGEPPAIGTVPRPLCGNGVLDAGEACDPGSPASDGRCSSACDVVDDAQCGGRLSICRDQAPGVGLPSTPAGFFVLTGDASGSTACDLLSNGVAVIGLPTFDDGFALDVGVGTRGPHVTCTGGFTASGTVTLSGISLAATAGTPSLVTVAPGATLRLGDVRLNTNALASEALHVEEAATVDVTGAAIVGVGPCLSGPMTVDNSLIICDGPESAGVTLRRSTLLLVTEPPFSVEAIDAVGGITRAGSPGGDVVRVRQFELIDLGGIADPQAPGSHDFAMRTRGAVSDIGGVEVGPIVGLDDFADGPIMVRRSADLRRLPRDIRKDVELTRNVAVPAVDTDRFGVVSIDDGTFDGKGFRIAELRRPLVAVNVLASGTVEDLSLTGAVTCAPAVTSCGGLAGIVDGAVRRVSFTGTVSDSNAAGRVAGGLVGACSDGAVLQDIAVSGSITGHTVGGLVGDVGNGCTVKRGRMSNDPADGGGGGGVSGTTVGGAMATLSGTAHQLVIGSAGSRVPIAGANAASVVHAVEATASLRDVEEHTSGDVDRFVSEIAGSGTCALLAPLPDGGVTVLFTNGRPIAISADDAQNPDAPRWPDARFRTLPWAHVSGALPVLDLDAAVESPPCQ